VLHKPSNCSAIKLIWTLMIVKIKKPHKKLYWMKNNIKIASILNKSITIMLKILLSLLKITVDLIIQLLAI